jgi:hypothetical protein
MACSTNPIRQPTLDISPLWFPLISKEIIKSKGKLVWSYNVLTYNCRIQFRRFASCSTDGALGYMSLHQHKFPYISDVFIHFLAYFVWFNSYFFCRIFCCMHVCHKKFYCILLLPLIDRTCFRVFIYSSFTAWRCPGSGTGEERCEWSDRSSEECASCLSDSEERLLQETIKCVSVRDKTQVIKCVSGSERHLVQVP